MPVVSAPARVGAVAALTVLTAVPAGSATPVTPSLLVSLLARAGALPSASVSAAVQEGVLTSAEAASPDQPLTSQQVAASVAAALGAATVDEPALASQRLLALGDGPLPAAGEASLVETQALIRRAFTSSPEARAALLAAQHPAAFRTAAFGGTLLLRVSPGQSGAPPLSAAGYVNTQISETSPSPISRTGLSLRLRSGEAVEALTTVTYVSGTHEYIRSRVAQGSPMWIQIRLAKPLPLSPDLLGNVPAAKQLLSLARVHLLPSPPGVTRVAFALRTSGAQLQDLVHTLPAMLATPGASVPLQALKTVSVAGTESLDPVTHRALSLTLWATILFSPSTVTTPRSMAITLVVPHMAYNVPLQLSVPPAALHAPLLTIQQPSGTP